MAQPIRLSLFIILATLISACAKPVIVPEKTQPGLLTVEREKQLSLALSQQMQRRQRVMDISFPLLAASSEICGENAKPSLGISFSNKYGIEEKFRDTAIRDLGLGDALKVTLVAKNSPAHLTGIETSDILISLNGKAFDSGKKAMQSVKQVMQPLKADQPVEMVVFRNGETRTLSITPKLTCKYPVLISNQDAVNAYANGRQIIITKGLLRFSQDDNDLALVIAHEIAHNTSGHIPKIIRNTASGAMVDLVALGFGIPMPGAFTIGAANFHRQSFEVEADYIGLYILAQSGRNIEGAADFWRRVAAEYPEQIDKTLGASHPSSPERFLAIESTIREIKEKQRLGKTLDLKALTTNPQ